MRAPLRKIEQLAAKTGNVFIATADPRGWPHIAAAGRLVITPEKHALVTEWFCPGTVKNLQVNPRVSVVVWDQATDTGYQIIGELEGIKDLGVLDGYSPKVEKEHPSPQIERQLLLHIDKVIEFKKSPHTDHVESKG